MHVYLVLVKKAEVGKKVGRCKERGDGVSARRMRVVASLTERQKDHHDIA